MEQPISHNVHEHVIHIARSGVSSISVSYEHAQDDSGELHNEDRPSTSTQPPLSQSSATSSTTSNSRNVSSGRRGDSNVRRRRSPLNSGLWISIELVVNLSQIIAAIIVLSLSRHEHPKAPLFTWAIGYTVGCLATLPHLYWRYIHRNPQALEQNVARQHQRLQNDHRESASFTALSVTQALEGSDRNNTGVISQFAQNLFIASPRLHALVEHLKMALDCFFAVWFVIGNVWIFGGHSSASDAPNLYRLCIVFLTFSCIGYAMPFVLCATICCCLPCIISVLGFREDLRETRGATTESISALPTYKFKLKRKKKRGESESGSEGPGEGGIVAAGTDKERTISAEDAACCICLAKYVDNDDLRELPCTHLFHTGCVDKWLKINALCPLCKSEVGDATGLVSCSNSG